MKDFAMQLTQKCVSMGLLDESYSEWFACVTNVSGCISDVSICGSNAGLCGLNSVSCTVNSESCGINTPD